MISFSYAGKSDVGLIRPNNEDAFVIAETSDYCLVADGMGGAAAGELASKIFADAVVEIFSSKNDSSEAVMVEKVQASFKIANTRILDHVQDNPEHKGMGCTAELLIVSSEGFVIGHMGDSRTYRMRDHRLQQLTKDHSLVQEQVDQGIISPEEARTHAMRNVILRAVGVKDRLALDILRGKVQVGDMFLLCSDGLTDLVEDRQIENILNQSASLSQKVDSLIGMAKDAGGKDNITVVLCMSGKA